LQAFASGKDRLIQQRESKLKELQAQFDNASESLKTSEDKVTDLEKLLAESSALNSKLES